MRYYRHLLLIFIAFALAEELHCSPEKTVSTVHQERPTVKVSVSERAAAHEISEVNRARGVYGGGGSIVRPTGKKNNAMASITISASLALLHVTIATLTLIFSCTKM